MNAQRDLLPPSTDAEVVELLERAGDTDALTDRWPAMLQALVDLFAAHLKRRGMDEDQALTVGRELAALEARYFGGRMVYLPGTERIEIALRNDAIWRDWRGNNRTELALRHKITERQVDNILAEQREIHRRRMQGELFETEVPSLETGALK